MVDVRPPFDVARESARRESDEEADGSEKETPVRPVGNLLMDDCDRVW
jgi:hypothetical protein